MNEQNMMQGMQFDRFSDCAETDAVADTFTAQPKMTKEELQQKTDEELLAMIQKAQGHTNKEFQEYMQCDFSYSYLTTALKSRGWENDWHKVSGTAAATPKPVTLPTRKSDDEIVRVSYMLDKSVAEEWKHFNKNVPYKTVTLRLAMKRFMDDVRSGRIKFELEIE